jgi:hypothetical protein
MTRAGLHGSRSTVLRESSLGAWLIWTAGVLLIPLTALLVPRGVGPYAIVDKLGGYTGMMIWAGWGIGIALMFFGMIRLRSISVRTAVAAQLCASAVIALLTVALASSDVYSYIVDGESAMHGWGNGVIPVTDDSTCVAVAIWGNPVGPTPYGAAFILFERTLLALVPHTATQALVLVHRFVAAFAAIGVTLLIRGPRVALWAINPFVLFEFPLNGHNDVLMLFLIAASMRIRQSLLSGFMVGLAGMVKVVALGALAFRRRGFLAAVFGTATGEIPRAHVHRCNVDAQPPYLLDV